MTDATLYTAAPSPRSQATSEIFRQYGMTNEIAVPIREVHVAPVSRPSAFTLALLPAIVCTAIQAAFFKTTMDFNGGPIFKSILAVPTKIKELFTSPDIVVSFGENNLGENTQALMAGLGFRKESTGFRHYYRGPATPSTVNTIVRNGGSMDTFAPYGATNIHGFSALRNLQKILLGVCAIFGTPVESQGSDLVDLSNWSVKERKVKNSAFRVKDLDAMRPNLPGILMPYFDGLNLVDKTTVPAIVLRHFLYLFGNTQENAMEAYKIFRNGWLSLSTSPQGLALTHLAFCIDIALQTGAKPFIIYTSRAYGGVVLIHPTLALLKGNKLYKAVSPALLIEGLKKLDSHSYNLSLILDILNPKLFGSSEKPENKALYADPSSISSARQLHNLLRNVKLDLEDLKIIRPAVSGLKFHTQHWEPLSTAHILQAARAIITGEFLDDSAPMLCKTEVLVTKDSILSTLAAFGASAPSIIGKGTSTSIVLSSKTYKRNMASNWNLDGFPIFVKALQEAHEEWTALRLSSTITLKLRLKDKKPATIMGLGKIIPFDEGGDRLNDIIAGWTQKQKEKNEKKRARAVTDTGGEDAAKRASKKSKSNKEAVAALAFMGLEEIAPADSMLVDNEDSD